MSSSVFVQALDLACGVFLLAAIGVLWRRDLAAIVRIFAVQGVALTAIVVLLAVHLHDVGMAAPAVVIGVLRAGVLPILLRRALTVASRAGGPRETEPTVNVTASLLVAAALTLLAYAVCRPLVDLDPADSAARALPVGLAVVLLGFFTLVTRRRALSQIVGFLLLDNGITVTAFLAASGVPLIVELGVSFDLLLAVLVLQVLTSRMRAVFGDTDLGELRGLRD